MDWSQWGLQTNGKLFSNFEFLAKKQKLFKRIVRREYWSKCNVLYTYQLIRLDKLYKSMGSFLQISESFFELITLFQNNTGVWFSMWGDEGIFADHWSARVIVLGLFARRKFFEPRNLQQKPKKGQAHQSWPSPRYLHTWGCEWDHSQAADSQPNHRSPEQLYHEHHCKASEAIPHGGNWNHQQRRTQLSINWLNLRHTWQ